MKSIAAALLASLAAACAAPAPPPVPVEVRVPVPVPCRAAEPVCAPPAYDAARKDQPLDVRVKLLRAEAATRADCERRYREALASCRAP